MGRHSYHVIQTKALKFPLFWLEVNSRAGADMKIACPAKPIPFPRTTSDETLNSRLMPKSPDPTAYQYHMNPIGDKKTDSKNHNCLCD